MSVHRPLRAARLLPLFALLLSLLPLKPDPAVQAAHSPAATAERVSSAPSAEPRQDNNVFWDGLGHDSRDTLYRVPGGAVTEKTPVTLRLRTFHGDVTSVSVRTYHTGLGAEQFYEMQPVARDVDCYDTTLEFSCDFWQATVDAKQIGTLYYRFVVRDGTATAYYEDDSEVRDGGWGKPYNQSPDWGWAIIVYNSNFDRPIEWMKAGVVYQIFPDRFRNADPRNDPAPDPSDPRYSIDPRYAYPNGDPGTDTQPAWDRIVRMKWGELPEGYCRHYQDIADAECPQRFPQPGGGREQPRGRDYYGGDLGGVAEKLDYLKQLGVTVIYLNPIFAAASNHRYDTRDYRVIDPYLGDLGDWQTLVREAKQRGIRIILDGVFNHMSSDSPHFDRYGNWDDKTHGAGACESVDSPYRHWFRFRPPRAGEPAACAPYTRDGPSYYESWAGFDSLPQLSEHADVQELIFGAQDSIARYWLGQGASGWRLDVMQDKSIPFWKGFREQVKAVDPDAIIIGELWKKFDVLPYVHGTTADTAMNYRLRDAVLGLLAPGNFDGKGFPGSGQPIPPSTFVERLQSVREDYPDATFYALMNLLGSHDTERLLWVLTPGAENIQARERNTANLAEGKQRQRLAALIQMTMPGAPTIYYGDEVALTGDDDPDDRRTFPWGDGDARRQGDTRQPDREMLAYYSALTRLRARSQALIDGDLRFLLADDGSRTVAYGRKHGDQVLVVALNASKEQRRVTIPVGGYLPNGTQLVGVAGDKTGAFTVQNNVLTLDLPALSGAVLATRGADLTPPAAPTELAAKVADLQVELTWSAAAGAASYNVYRSPVSDGGYVKLNDVPITEASFVDADPELRSGQRYFYVVRALDTAGNESDTSNEASAVPSYRIDWANLQWPAELNYTVSAAKTTDAVYGQAWIDGVTEQPGPAPGLIAQLGYGAQGSDPRAWRPGSR